MQRWNPIIVTSPINVRPIFFTMVRLPSTSLRTCRSPQVVRLPSGRAFRTSPSTLLPSVPQDRQDKSLTINGSASLAMNGSTSLTTSPSTTLRINGSFTLTINGSTSLTINGSAPLTTSRVHNCSPINMRGIRITIKVLFFLLLGGENGQLIHRIHRERVRRIRWGKFWRYGSENGVRNLDLEIRTGF